MWAKLLQEVQLMEGQYYEVIALDNGKWSLLEDDKWSLVLGYFLSRSDRFRAVLPDDDFIGKGREEFQAFNPNAIKPSFVMSDTVAFEDDITPELTPLILKWAHTPGRYGGDYYLWDYCLSRDGYVILDTRDFSVVKVFLTESDKEALRSLGIDSTCYRELGWDLPLIALETRDTQVKWW